MIRKSKRTQPISRARAKHIKCVRVRSLHSRSTTKPNASDSEIVFGCRSTSDYATLTSVPLKAAKASTKSECSQKASRRRQSVEVQQNAPIIERAFCRSSSEIRHNLSCHMAEEMTLDDQEFYEDQHVSPCDLVHECLGCKYFHDDFFNILDYRTL